jgi:hypothetical protein
MMAGTGSRESGLERGRSCLAGTDPAVDERRVERGYSMGIGTWHRGLILLLAVIADPFWRGAIRAQEAEGEKTDGTDEESTSDFKSAKDLSESDRRILDLFKATEKRFEKDGKIYLRYDFERMKEDLVDDWSPDLKAAKNRVRWARRLEGTLTSIEHGIIVGDHGEWIHEAVFRSDVVVDVDFMCVSQHKPGNILGPVFWSEKKKQSIGANFGQQVMCLKGFKPAKPLYPPQQKPVLANTRQVMGFKYDGKVLEATTKKKRMADSEKVPKFADGMDTGHVGLAWNGAVQGFIFSVTIEGFLSPEWVSKQLEGQGEEKKIASRRSR